MTLTRARAVQAVIWGMPAVTFELLHRAALEAGAHDKTWALPDIDTV